MLRWHPNSIGTMVPDTDAEKLKADKLRALLSLVGPDVQTYGMGVDAGLVALVNNYLGTFYLTPNEVAVEIDAILVGVEAKIYTAKEERSILRDIAVGAGVGILASLITSWFTRKR